MLSTRKITTASNAAGYYAKENYYSQNTAEPSQWFGRAAEKLGLAGVVNKDQFAQILDGTLPNGDQLGLKRAGERIHVPGWDLTFSAPKSVSILALVGGDERLIEAHDRAVRSALAQLESHHVGTRANRNTVQRFLKTDNIVAATFRHDVNRSQEPHLHTHSVIANVTEMNDMMRSIESYSFIRRDVIFSLGLHYRQELAYAAKELGYEIEREKDGFFNIAGVPKELIDRYSSRSADVVKFLESRDLSRDTATAEDRQKAVLYTRPWKRTVDRKTLATTWHESSQEFRNTLQTVISASEDRLESATQDLPAREVERRDPALEIVKRAANSLSERQARFTEESLRDHAGKLAIGKATPQQIESATRMLVETGDLIPKSVTAPSPTTRRDETYRGFTLPQMQKLETRMLLLESQGRGALNTGLARKEALQVVDQAAEMTSRLYGHNWTKDQRSATVEILTSNDRISAVQGLAGTAKTTTVLATAAATWASQGHRITALAPTASAATLLGETLEVDGQTVQGFLANRTAAQQQSDRSAPPGRHPIWVVDEASMVGVKDMTRLFEQADRYGAKLILAGDSKQLSSVESGAAFRQLQSEGMRTTILEDIVRQSDRRLRQAVTESVNPETAGQALQRLDSHPDTVIEIKSNTTVRHGQQERYEAIAHRYASMDLRERDDTLVLDPSRDGRRALNDAIRRNLQLSGKLHSKNHTFTILTAANLTNGEKRDSTNYARGMIIQLGRSQVIQKQQFHKGAYFHVVERDGETVHVQALDPFGRTQSSRTYSWVPLAHANNATQIFKTEDRSLSEGDRIVWKQNQKISGLKNNTLLTITAMSEKSIGLRKPTGETISLDPRRIDSRHWEHGYALTLHAAQGQTAKRSLIHAETFRINLINTAAFYVAISRAKEAPMLFTDNKLGLREAIQRRAGQSPQSLDKGERKYESDQRAEQKPKSLMEALRDLLDRGRGDLGKSRDAALKALLPDRQAETRAPDQRDPSKIPPIQKPETDREKDLKRSQSADQTQPDKKPGREKQIVRSPVQYDMD